MEQLVRGWINQSKLRELLGAVLRRDFWALSSASYLCGGSWSLQRAKGTAWAEGWWLLQKPQLRWLCQVSPGKGLGEGPCRWQSHSSPPIPPLSHWSLHAPTNSSILLLVPPSSLYPPVSPSIPALKCGKQGRELPFQDGTCPSVPARPLESLTGQHVQICSPRSGWEPLSKVSTRGRCKHAQDWPKSLLPPPWSGSWSLYRQILLGSIAPLLPPTPGTHGGLPAGFPGSSCLLC